MELTDKVVLIKQYIDTRGNFYPSGEYQYGELPLRIRDSNDYIRQIGTIELKQNNIVNSITITEETINSKPKDEIVPKYTKEEVVPTEVVPPVIINVPKKKKHNESTTNTSI